MMPARSVRVDDKAFQIANYSILALILVTVLFPLWFVIIASFSNPDAINRGEVIFWIEDFDLIGYDRVFRNQAIWIGYGNTVIYAALGVVVALALTLPFAYALSRREFAFRRFFVIMMLITWYFHGGLIPTFLIIRALGLYNTRAIIIILGSFSVWNTIIARTFFRNTIPDDLWEASLIDGCNHFQYFGRVVVPLSKAIIVVLVLFSAVAQWNDFFKGLMFLTEENKYPLQLVLRGILIQSTTESGMMDLGDIQAMNDKERLAGVIRYCVVIIGALPLLIVYPFFQKYFMQGVMIGSVKG
jgi:ABC-type glycerol-3-phosphate transport system permease component